MKTILIAALAALALPSAAFAAEPVVAPEKECCCEKMKDEKGCCDKMKGHEVHQGHDPASH